MFHKDSLKLQHAQGICLVMSVCHVLMDALQILSISPNADSSGLIKQIDFYYFIYYLSLEPLLPPFNLFVCKYFIQAFPPQDNI